MASSEMNPKNIASIENRLGYIFGDKSVLIRAVTRKAFAQEQKQQGQNCDDQEVYRVFGDAILKAILVEMLLQDGYDSRETITNRKIELEKRESLGAKLREMEIAQFIRFSRGEQKQNAAIQSSVLGETFEALIAAIYIDGGSYETTKRVVFKLFDDQRTKKLSQSEPKKASTISVEDVATEIWQRYNGCDTCFQIDVCASMGVCYYDITGDN